MGPHHLERVEALGGEGKQLPAHVVRLARHHRSPDQRSVRRRPGLYRATADELEGEIRRVFDRIAAERAPGAS